MASNDRFKIQRTDKGGVSLGWTLYSDYRKCPALFGLRYAHGQDGLRPREHAVSEAMLYGQLWHATWRAHIGKHDLREACLLVLAEDGLREAEWRDLVNEVLADFQWFVDEPKTFRMTVLLAESELTCPVPCAAHHPLLVTDCPDCGRHEMRGTLDLCGRIEADWGAEIMLLDWKTADKVNDPRNTARHRSSRQITYYLALLQRARPDLATLRGLIGMVPSHILEKLARRRKKDEPPPGVKLVWALRHQAHLDRIVADYRRAADQIAHNLDHPESAHWSEHPDSCVSVAFGPCPMLPICDADPDARTGLIDSLYAPRLSPREVHEEEAEHMLDTVFDEEVTI